MNNRLFKKYFPKKSLGQNFLCDKNVISKIVDFIDPKGEDCLVEIGPGLAALTYPISKFVEKLFIIEIDKKLLLYLKDYSFYKKLCIFNMNVLDFDFKQLSLENHKMLRIFGNIPYNISVKLILFLIKFNNYICDINFMVQKEVAERLVAIPGTKFYGRLSIIVQCYYDISIGFNISPKSFFPIPKIDSTFIYIRPKQIPFYSSMYLNNLSKITFFAFQKRRKFLKNSLSNLFNQQDLLNLGINPYLRAENLSVMEYCKLANFYEHKK
ncbi:16S rRNA (adenine(1518)-N(6)/adenine(1519)-N(6))-dimethyltransferase RsmA [Buchnera aphidicola]|uniref:16S rRNA (adenine(1518)-N(6)/adenine(1519)-N(6))- dimethyltransferase RsmA n=1 Tax=Buchnera aphidicola TaxID=9 RepID=UPI0034641F17